MSSFLEILLMVVSTPHFYIAVLGPALVALVLWWGSATVRQELEDFLPAICFATVSNTLIAMLQILVINSRFDSLSLHLFSFILIPVFLRCYYNVQVPSPATVYIASWVSIFAPDVFGAFLFSLYSLHPTVSGDWLTYVGGGGWFDTLFLAPPLSALVAFAARAAQRSSSLIKSL